MSTALSTWVNLELLQNIIHHISTKRRTSSKHRRIAEFKSHVLDPLMMLIFRSVQLQNQGHMTKKRNLIEDEEKGRREMEDKYLWVTRIRRMIWILSLLSHCTWIKLLLWIGVVAGVYVLTRCTILLWSISLAWTRPWFHPEGYHTGSWARIDWNCGPERTLLAWRNSSSVRMVEMERFIWAASGILSWFWGLFSEIEFMLGMERSWILRLAKRRNW
jgi:hypothetical protein